MSSYQQIDEEEFGGVWELTKEGFMTSFAGFLVSYLLFNYSVENLNDFQRYLSWKLNKINDWK